MGGTVRRAISAAAAIAGAALLITACSSSGNSQSTAGSTSSSGSRGDAAGVARAKAFVAPFIQGTQVTLSVPLKSLPAPGKQIYWLQNNIPDELSVTSGFNAAAKLLGWHVHTLVVSPGDPSQVNSAVQQAVTAGADFIAVDTAPIQEYQQAMDAAKAAHIPVFGLFGTDQPEGAKNGLYQQIGPSDFSLFGSITANYNIADSNGTANELLVNVPSFTVLGPMVAAEKAAYAQNCPKTCSLYVMNLSPDQANNSSEAASIVVSYLQEHPQTKYVRFAYGGVLSTDFTSALKAANLGSSGIVVDGSNPVLSNLQEVVAGTQRMWVGLPLALSAWYAVDAMARYSEGMSLAPSTLPILPTQMLTKTDVAIPINPQGYGGPPGYEAVFEKLWLVS
jgi:ABC-type sugar transport system substrate-binding protein